MVSREKTEASHSSAKSRQNSALGDSPGSAPKQNLTVSSHSFNTSTQPKCAKCVYPDGLPEDLAEVVAAWSDLALEVGAEILAKIRATQ